MDVQPFGDLLLADALHVVHAGDAGHEADFIGA
jgi:hypothetical protein